VIASRARLVWLCRRGTRELDLLLRGYLERDYDHASATERRAFAALLEKPDPELQALFFASGRPAEPELQSVIGRILGSAATEA